MRGLLKLMIAGVSLAGLAACNSLSYTPNGNGSTLSQYPQPAPTQTSTGTATSAPGSTTGVLAVSANVFLNSLGVNTHASQGYSISNYVTPLQYTGIRNVRDGTGTASTLVTLHQETGVKMNIMGEGDLTQMISDGQTLTAANALLSFEGPNEPNNFTMTYNGQTGGGSGSWVPVADFQNALYTTVKSTSGISQYPVFGVSEEGAETTNLGLQFTTVPSGSNTLVADGTQYADYVNIHNYVSSNENTWVDNMAWQAASPTLNSFWDGLYGEVGVTWSKQFQGYSNAQLLTVPRVTTETGWDSTSNPGGQTGQGVVLTNTYLAQFKEGWSYTFIYELVDGEGSTGDQGLYTSTYTAKLSATYIHNLTTVLADTATIASPGRVNYTIPNEPATVHDLLLQKNNGTFELVVWDERSTATTDSVTVNLGASYPTVNVYDITIGSTPNQTLSNASSVPLTLNNHAVIIELP
jgi:hypothetical protein